MASCSKLPPRLFPQRSRIPRDPAMRMRGLEPPRGCPHTDLNRARLPIPPHPRAADIIAGAPNGSLGARDPTESVRTMAGVLRLALIAVLALPALVRGRRDGCRRPVAGRSSRSSSRSTQPPLAARRPGPHARQPQRSRPAAQPERPGDQRRACARSRPRSERCRNGSRRPFPTRPSLALPDRRERSRGRAPRVGGRAPRRRARRPHRLPERDLPPLARPRARRRSARRQLWGPEPDREHGRGAEDRRHRHRRRRERTRSSTRPRTRCPPASRRARPAFTTAKVIVARAFPPPGATGGAPRVPFHGDESDHGTHVAGIAAGNANTIADTGSGGSASPESHRARTSATTTPSPCRATFGLNGNSPELVAAIEAAVADGMDVINLSLSRGGDRAVARPRGAGARRAPRAPGVVPVVAGGNSFDELGRGSVNSPASSALAISVGAVSTDPGRAGEHDHELLVRRPDAALPAAEAGRPRARRRTSSPPSRAAGSCSRARAWRARWSPARRRSCASGIRTGRSRSSSRRSLLTATSAAGAQPGRPVRAPEWSACPRADTPLVFASPSSVSFGLVRRGSSVSRAIDALRRGRRPRPWAVRLDRSRSGPGSDRRHAERDRGRAGDGDAARRGRPWDAAGRDLRARPS